MGRDFDSRVRSTGLKLFQMMGEETPSVFDRGSWAGKVLDLCMRDESFKTDMLRFIDVLPYLRGPESVAEHMKEYFNRPEQRLPKDLGLFVGRVSPVSVAARKRAERVTRKIRTLGRQFVAGTTPQEALAVLDHLRSDGVAFSLDLLGEAVVSEKEAEAYVEQYLKLLDLLGRVQEKWKSLGDGRDDLDWGHAAKINVSIKPSALYSQMSGQDFEHSVSRAKERLRPIFRRALTMNAHICLDMEQVEFKNLTLAIFRGLLEEPEFRGYPHSGTVIQTYLRDSGRDLQELVRWARSKKQKLTIRLVKGAYWEAEMAHAGQRNWALPFFADKHETDANFEKQARYLLEKNEWIRLACASQNIRSIAYVMETARELKVPQEHLEYQVLCGMAEPVQKALREAGVPLRVYTPVGEMVPGMAYLIRRLLESTSKNAFLRQSFAEGVAKTEHLKNPLTFLAEDELLTDSGPRASRGSEKGPFENEPPRDWTVEKHRKRFKKALQIHNEAFPYRVPLVIDGKKVSTEKTIRSNNPNRPEEAVGIVSSAGKREADKAIRAAGAAFPVWRDTDPSKRVQILLKAAAVARKMSDELAALQVYEVGKTWIEADGDVCEAIDFLEYYGREMLRLAAPQTMLKVPGEQSDLFYEPRGVAAVIAPWNFPFAISMGMTSAALVTGNTVVYKPSSNSCVTGSMVSNVFERAGLPKGVLNFLPGPGEEIGDYLVTHPDVALVAFTGSKEVGLRIVALAGETPPGAIHVKNVLAEMGGKNAIIVDADANLDEAVVHVLYSAFGYQGQKCSACSRLIVLEEVHDKLLDRLLLAADSLELGNPEDPATFMGAVIDRSAKKKILKYIDIGKKEGEVVLEKRPPRAKGYFVPLTVLKGIRPEHRVAQEEIFGPVLAVIKVRDFNEALEVANGTPYALTGGLFSRSPKHIALAKEKFRVGNLYINRGCTGSIVGRHPFGGFKMSGVGSKAGGPDYLFQFMVPRNVAENTLRRGFAPMES